MENSLGISELSREQYHKDGYNPSLSLSLYEVPTLHIGMQRGNRFLYVITLATHESLSSKLSFKRGIPNIHQSIYNLCCTLEMNKK
jgi:hypothetical protein